VTTDAVYAAERSKPMKTRTATKIGIIVGIFGAAIIVADAQQAVVLPPPASGTCPQGVKECKIVSMTPEEVQSLIAPQGIFSQAEWASRSSMGPLVEAWKQKIQQAPAGKMYEEPEKKKEDKLPAGK